MKGADIIASFGRLTKGIVNRSPSYSSRLLLFYVKPKIRSYISEGSRCTQANRHLHFIFYQLTVGNAVSLPCPVICLYNAQVNYVFRYLMETSKFLNHLPLLFSCENCSKVRRRRRNKGRRKCAVNTFQFTCGTILLFELACSAGVFWVGETLFVFVILLSCSRHL